MQKWNLVFDVALCTGCQNCVLAVQDEYQGNEFPGYAAEMPRHGPKWFDIERRERGEFPAVDVAHRARCCQHCDQAPCREAASGGAVKKRDDGIVVIDPVLSRGQKPIADACPFGAAHWDEARAITQHWNFDAHLLDAGWKEPRPVQACPTGALRSLKLEDEAMQRLAAEQGLVRTAGGEARGTRVWYRNLTRFTHAFAAGTLVGLEAGLDACVAGAQVRLARAGEPVASARSDAFGDFRFDHLPPASEGWRIDIEAHGYHLRIVEFNLKASCWLGEIRLEPA
ncbi:MAG: oxidoreductase [Burkholderiales bacterium]|nr:oxidoreductase [Burkholderiales bacterium]